MTTPVSAPTDLSDQTAVVTGAAGAIGGATCEALAREGADVVAADVVEDGLEETAERVEAQGGQCETVVCDVTDQDDIDTLRDVALETFDSVEIVVGTHGIVMRQDITEMDIDDWSTVVDVNLRGMVFLVRAFFDHMRENGYGKVVCFGSIAGKVGGVDAGPSYVSAKGGVHAFVKWGAKNGAPHGVYVNGIAPGPVISDMTRGESYSADAVPLDRLGEPEDPAEGAVFLASQQSNWITGTILDVNGGMFMQ